MTDSQSYNSVTHNLTIEQKEYAVKVLNETDENRENAIAEIKRWIQDSDLRARTDDFFILRFLRVCKFNIEKTKTRIENFQKQRVNLPEWCANRDPLLPELQELLNLGICLPLRKLDNQGRMVILARASYNPDIFTIDEVFKVLIMVIDIALKDSVETSLYGVVIIVDLQLATFRHIVQIRPRNIMNVTRGLQIYPVRIKQINGINVPEYAKFMVAMAKCFLTNKLKQRLHVYSNKTSRDCFANIPANILPVEYGGTDGTIQDLTEYWKKVIEEHRDWFIDDEKYKPVL